MTNIILATDSYKVSHAAMYPANTQYVYSYFEARPGATFDETVFFGLQAIIDRYLSKRVLQSDLDEAIELTSAHFGAPLLNVEGWQYIIDEHDGYLPIRIKAVPEGTPVPVGNVMMTVENTDPQVPWLTNYVESLLTHVWYPSTVATVSREVKKMIAGFLMQTTGSLDGIDFMLHDFGYRGVSSHESAEMGGAGHLVNFKGTDTLPAMQMLRRHYAAKLDDLAFSVPATEHSIMTSMGPDGEENIVRSLLDNYPTGILSVVADSYDYYSFVDTVVSMNFKDRILARDGVFVVRPDSVTDQHPTPESLAVWTLQTLWGSFGGTETEQGYKVLDPHVRVLWGDGIDPAGIERILAAAMETGFAASNLVFGMGGGLLQKVNRDTQRFAFKCSARHDGEKWQDVFKKPLDVSKASKAGRLSLIPFDGGMTTVAEADHHDDMLQVVFDRGWAPSDTTLEDVREHAQIKSVTPV